MLRRLVFVILIFGFVITGVAIGDTSQLLRALVDQVLLNSTHLEGNVDDEADDTAVDSRENVSPNSTDFLAMNPYQGPNAGPSLRSADYLPLDPGTIWKYLNSSNQQLERRVLKNKVKVSGVETSVVRYVEEKTTEYYTADSDGIFLHRIYQPNVRVSGVGLINIDATFIPPVELAGGIVEIGAQFSSSGTARTVVTPLGRVFNFAYTALSSIDISETVTVPAGSFDTIRNSYTATVSSPYGDVTVSSARNLAEGVGVVKEGTAELIFTNAGVHDLAITEIAAPRTITLTSKKPSTTLPVKVRVQNRSLYPETIADATILTNLITLTVGSLGDCPSPTPVLHSGAPQWKFPVVLKSKSTLTVYYDVAFDCANDPARSTGKDPGHFDYRYNAVINHAAIDGRDDSHPEDNMCPRSVTPPYEVEPYPDETIKEKGCGTRKPDGTYGGDILTDVVVR